MRAKSMVVLGAAISLAISTAPASSAQMVDIPGIGAVGMEVVAGVAGVAAIGSLGSLALSNGSQNGAPGAPGDPGDPGEPGDPAEITGPDGTVFSAEQCNANLRLTASGAAQHAGLNTLWGGTRPSEFDMVTDLRAPVAGLFEGVELYRGQGYAVGPKEPLPYFGNDFDFYYKMSQGNEVIAGVDATDPIKAPLHKVTIPAASIKERCPVSVPEENPAPHNEISFEGHPYDVSAFCAPGSNAVSVRTENTDGSAVQAIKFNDEIGWRTTNDSAYLKQFWLGELPIKVQISSNGTELSHTFTKC